MSSSSPAIRVQAKHRPTLHGYPCCGLAGTGNTAKASCGGLARCLACQAEAETIHFKIANSVSQIISTSLLLPSDLDSIAVEWLTPCGPHDVDVMTSPCTCPRGDPRVVISNLVDEVRRLRMKIATKIKVVTKNGPSDLTT